MVTTGSSPVSESESFHQEADRPVVGSDQDGGVILLVTDEIPVDPGLSAPRWPRYLSLDAWRGLACLFIVIYHSTTVADRLREPSISAGPAAMLLDVTRKLWIGVPIFFVISGYCIAATVDLSRRRPHPIRTFFGRRIRRIYPPYYGALALQTMFLFVVDVILVPGILSRSAAPIGRPWQFTPWQWLGNLTLTESWRFHVLGDRKGYILGQAWTLCYEEQFYAIMGLILVLMPRRLFAGVALVTVATLLTKHGMPWPSSSIKGVFLDGNWLMFAAGVLVYYHSNYVPSILSWKSVAMLGLLANYAIAMMDASLLTAAVTAGLLIVLRRWDGPIAGWIGCRTLAFCGTICYSLYLVHAPIVRAISQGLYELGIRSASGTLLVTIPLCLASSVLAGWLFHYAIERRFLNNINA